MGIFVTAAFVREEYREAVSGHVQISLMAASILAIAGHNVTLITTKEPDAHYLPYELASTLQVCIVQHATRAWPEHRVYAGKAIKQTLQLLRLMRKGRFDVVHFFGGTTTGLLLCILKSMGIRSVAFYTPTKRLPVYQSAVRNSITKSAFKRVCRVLATADYVSSGWASFVGEHNVLAMYPGIMKQISESPGTACKNSVLFWRNAGYDNGVDIAVKSFRTLAPKYPDTRFVFAVRPHDQYEEELLELGREVENVDVHIYPYGNGVSLAGLFRNARFVVQPFRSLSVNPQMSILETLYAGIPVIATAVESNDEVIRHEQNGLLIPPNDEAALSSAIERLLSDTRLLAKLTRDARRVTECRWNWDSFGRRLLGVYDGLC
ncbi:MAG TPA: glycosyltransferase family 4 protein [Pyrinomonadaceae bacterium]|nr:glycosyltransferase family 4 protein [Pyrinomonadaceae bacterium]